MAKIIITSTTNSIIVTFGDYSTALEMLGGCWRKNNVGFEHKSSFVEGSVLGERDWCVSDVEDLANNILQVDLVDGVAPTSKVDLNTKLQTLLA